MVEFIVNDYITLKLERGKANIYVKDNLFTQCKYLLLNIPIEKVSLFEEIESVDEAAERLDKSLESLVSQEEEIPPEVEFWGHCSNMQVWSESNYDTRLLHRNIAFPLLKKLTDVGDPVAKKVFKEEIIKRFASGNESVKQFLYMEEYISYLGTEDIVNGLLKPQEANVMNKLISISKIKYKFVSSLSEDEVRERIFFNTLYFSEKNGYINQLELDLNQFDHCLPDFLSKFKKLIRLKIYAESKKEVTLKFNLGSYSVIDLTIHVKGKVIIPDSFEIFPNVSYLSIFGDDDVKFEKTPNTLGSLNNLKWLEIRYISLKEFPVTITKLKNLENLELIETALKELPESISELKSLETLNFHGNPNLKRPKSYEKLLKIMEENNKRKYPFLFKKQLKK